MSINANTFRLDGRVALVTGSSTGIGLSIARGLGEAGATVVLNARNAGRLKEAAAQLADQGLKVHTRAFDVTDVQAVDAAIEAVEHEVGPIQVLVNTFAYGVVEVGVEAGAATITAKDDKGAVVTDQRQAARACTKIVGQ